MSYTTMTPYAPVTDFSQDEADQVGGRSTVDTSALDAELAAIDTLTDALISNMDCLLRSDGKLQDRVVELHTLHPDIITQLAGSLVTTGNLSGDIHYFADTGTQDNIV